MNLTKFSSNIRRLCSSSNNVSTTVKIKSNQLQEDRSSNSYLGQPSYYSHSHKFKPNEVTLGVEKREFCQRREKFMNILRHDAQKMGAPESARHCVIVPAATTAYSAPDVPYPFRQESNFLYLCGYQEPDSFLMLLSDNGAQQKCRSTLFVQSKDKEKELWHGPIPGVDGAVTLTGVDEAFNIEQLKSTFTEMLTKSDYIWYDPLGVGLKGSQLAQDLMLAAAAKGRNASSPYKYVHQLRWLKSAAEIRLLRRAGEIGSAAFVETMKYSYPGVDENFLVAKMDFECRLKGAERLAYPPVIAGGDRANIIHYLNADQIVNKDELILMDAGCEYGGYVSDITRCWPVSKRFTDPQRVLYELLLEVQLECLKYVQSKRHLTLRDLYFRMLNVLADRMTSTGVIRSSSTKTKGEILRLVDEFCPHHVSHYLGMDVHDTETVAKNIPLQPNVVITVEPGLYFKSCDTRVPEEFRGIGLRLEDDILITETGIDVLTASCPKSIDDLERNVFSLK